MCIFAGLAVFCVCVYTLCIRCIVANAGGGWQPSTETGSKPRDIKIMIHIFFLLFLFNAGQRADARGCDSASVVRRTLGLLQDGKVHVKHGSIPRSLPLDTLPVLLPGSYANFHHACVRASVHA